MWVSDYRVSFQEWITEVIMISVSFCFTLFQGSLCGKWNLLESFAGAKAPGSRKGSQTPVSRKAALKVSWLT